MLRVTNKKARKIFFLQCNKTNNFVSSFFLDVLRFLPSSHSDVFKRFGHCQRISSFFKKYIDCAPQSMNGLEDMDPAEKMFKRCPIEANTSKLTLTNS